jgi:germination protein M
MRRFCLALFLPLALLISACTSSISGSGSPGEIPVYRVVSEEKQASGELISFENVDVPKGGSPLRTAIDALNSPAQQTGLVSAIPPDVQISAISVERGVASVRVSAGYQLLSGMERTLINSCITLTLCTLEDIGSVSIYAEGSTGAAAEFLTAESVLLYDTEAIPYEKQLRLYFPDIGGEYLRSEYHTLTVDTNTPLERYIIEELLRGPYDSTLLEAIPDDVTLLSIVTEDDLCTVEFSGEFLENMSASPAEARLTIYSIVNSLTALKEIARVQFLVEGEPLLSYGHVSLIKPLEKNENAIGP